MATVEMPDLNVDNPREVHWGILVLPNFPILAYSGLIDALRVANTVTGLKLYKWTTVSASELRPRASCGLEVKADCVAGAAPSVDRIVVVSGVEAHEFGSATSLSWMRREQRRGAAIGAVSDGAFFLARAGLMEGYRCTLHWRVQSSFREAFPHIDCSRDLFVIDRDRFTSAGGVGSLDMMLAMMEIDHGTELAMAVAEWFMHSRYRSVRGGDRYTTGIRTGARDARVLRAVDLMEQNVEEPLSANQIAGQLGLSVDTLERVFRRETGKTTIQFYLTLRYRRAQDLLIGTSLSISEIAVASGFSNSSSFARGFKSLYGMTPRVYRNVGAKFWKIG
ncbi:GlxA family transcriptional regulator [Pacificispira spongiicola]|nr:GlxA family transcriptional regulator [Pacificispira spongiicola]